MKIVLVSNYLNPHMKPLCDALYAHKDVTDFHFIATEPFGEERLKMGFCDMQTGVPYVVKAYSSKEEKRNAIEIVRSADVAIVAHAPNEYVDVRMQQNKLTFLSSERFFKLGLWRRWLPSSYKKKWDRFLKYKEQNLYYLTIGAYTSYDLSFVGFPTEKCYQWAYFPEVLTLPIRETKPDEKLKIFWAGRLIQWKHPELALKLAIALKKEAIPFELKIAGDGKLTQRLQRRIKELQLEEDVEMLGNCTPEQVQRRMHESDIFLFSSDYCEGWGAVLSEAMAAGCVPIASTKAGASLILVENRKNGFLFKNEAELKEIARKINFEKNQLNVMAATAQETVCEEWSPIVAANRFVSIAQHMITDTDEPIFTDGPMKKAVRYIPKNYITTNF